MLEALTPALEILQTLYTHVYTTLLRVHALAESLVLDRLYVGTLKDLEKEHSVVLHVIPSTVVSDFALYKPIDKRESRTLNR